MKDRLTELFNKGFALHKAGRLFEANTIYEQVLTIDPGYFDALHLSGLIAFQTKDPQKALVRISQAIEINSQNAEAYFNYGCVLQHLKRFPEALESYQKAVKLNPDLVTAHFNASFIHIALQQYPFALQSLDRVIALNPGHADAHNNRANVLKTIGQKQACIESYNQAIALKPECVDTYKNRGLVLSELKQHRAAVADFDKVIELNPNVELFYGLRLHSQMTLCDWHDFERHSKHIEEKIAQGIMAATPFIVQTLTSSPELHQKAAQLYAQHILAGKLPQQEVQPYPKHSKIRIAYFSAEFRNHAVAFLTAELFESHDRNKFELIAFSFGPVTTDDMSKRIGKAFDHFIPVQTLADEEIAAMARTMEIDIAVDLGGYTGSNRPGIFALRVAPVQVSYIGFLGTLGAEFIDYLIADTTLIPDEARQFYTEKIVFLPSYQVNDSQRRIADRCFTRHELGLPETGFVFCCFNNIFKITPKTFDSWMRILHAVQDSVLLLFAENEDAVENLKQEAERRSVNAKRLIFGKHLPVQDYLARYKNADLFLDTLPYNAGTTASDALWAGLPVLTCMGESFASRVAASVLMAIDLPELITANTADYEALAIELASSPDKLKGIKYKLARNRLTAPLFRTADFTRSIEAAYNVMYQRCHAGLAKKHIVIKHN